MSNKHGPLSILDRLGLHTIEDMQRHPASRKPSPGDVPVSPASLAYTSPEHQAVLDLVALLEDLPQKIQEAVTSGVVNALKAQGSLPTK